jgi:ribosomal protein L34E
MSRPARAAGKGEGVGQRSGQRVERLARGKQKVGTMPLRGASCNAPQEVSQRSERAVFGEHFCPECVRKVMKSVLCVVANSPFGRG